MQFDIYGIQVSTDGGQVMVATIYAEMGTLQTMGPATGPTTFTIGNRWGTATLTPGTINPTQAAANWRYVLFQCRRRRPISTQVLQLSDSTKLAGGGAMYTGAQAIWQGPLLSQWADLATPGTGDQLVTTNFNALGTTGAIQSGMTTFTTTPAQAAVTSNGVVLDQATALAGPDI